MPLHLGSHPGVTGNHQVGFSSLSSQNKIDAKSSSYHFSLKMPLEEDLLFSYRLNDSSTVIAHTQQCWRSRSSPSSVSRAVKSRLLGDCPKHQIIIYLWRKGSTHSPTEVVPLSARQIQSSLGQGTEVTHLIFMVIFLDKRRSMS